MRPTTRLLFHTPQSSIPQYRAPAPLHRASLSYQPQRTTSPAYIARASISMASATSFYEFKTKDSTSLPSSIQLPLSSLTNSTPAEAGKEFDLGQLKGKTVLVVNTASKCGFTPQFEGLEKLYGEVKAKHPNDFEMLGFPCNQFGGQDPGTDDDIQSFCQVNYGVSFPILKKTEVNGDAAEPVYQWMKAEQPGLFGMKRIKWNFEKFLIGPDGKVKGRWASTTKPEGLKDSILKELASKPSATTSAEAPQPAAETENVKAEL